MLYLFIYLFIGLFIYLFISCALAHATGAAMMLMESGMHMIYTALDSLSLI